MGYEMSRKSKLDPITGSTKQPWGRVFIGGLGFFGILTAMAIFLPGYSESYFFITLPIGIVGIIAFVWMNANPNLWIKLLGFIAIAALFTIIAIRSFNHLFPQLANVISPLIILTTVFAHTLPLWHLALTRFLRRELSFTPQTRTGKILLKIAFALLPISGFIGAAIGLFLHGGQDKISYRLLILGPLCWLLAVILPFSTQYPISPWEQKTNNLTE